MKAALLLVAGCFATPPTVPFATRPVPPDAKLGAIYGIAASAESLDRATGECAPRMYVEPAGFYAPDIGASLDASELARWRMVQQAQGNLIVVWSTSVNQLLETADGVTFPHLATSDWTGTLYACPNEALISILKEAPRWSASR